MTYRELISWCVEGGFCVRDCLRILREHQVNLDGTGAMKMVLEQYMRPADKEEIAREHFRNQDSASVCVEHLDTAFPHLPSGELLLCMWKKGYKEEDILQALRERRPQLTEEDTRGLLLTMIKKEEKKMDLNEQMTQLEAQKKQGQMTEVEWRRALAQLAVTNDPADVAAFLKDQGESHEQIAMDLKEIFADHRAVTVGGILLDPRVYPMMTRDEMKQILEDVFPEENIEQALGILYPEIVSVAAREIWKDTGARIEEDEIVTVRYLTGLWNANPSGHPADYGPEGLMMPAKPGYACPGAREGSLVGRIGEGDSFSIGKKASLPKGSGTLFLAINDDVDARYGNGYTDNRGEIMVEVRRELR